MYDKLRVFIFILKDVKNKIYEYKFFYKICNKVIYFDVIE